MTAAQQAALDKWAEIYESRFEIEQFLDWAGAEGLGTFRFAYSRSAVLDRFYGVNRADLEAGRRALIEEVRSPDHAFFAEEGDR